MTLTNLRIALRSLLRRTSTAAVNVVGLAVGLATCACIFLFVQDELSYDDFRPASDRLYRVVTDMSQNGQTARVALSPQPVGPALAEERGAVEAYVRLYDLLRDRALSVETQSFRGRHVPFAEPAVFDVLGVSLVRGAADAVLSRPFTIVLTRSTAETLYGDADPVGRTVEIGERTYTVTGIVEDPPSNTHLQFDALRSYVSLDRISGEQWTQSLGNINAYTYLRLREGTDARAFERSIRDWASTVSQSSLAERMTLGLEAVTRIHLHSDRRFNPGPSGDIRYVYLFGAVAVLVLVVAGINFTNLAVARSLERAAETGVRKAVGSSRRQLVGQFLAESVLTAGLAGVLAVGLTAAALPLVNGVSGKSLSLLGLASPAVLGGAVLSVVAVGLAAGGYPALVLSRFRPAEVLRGSITATGSGRRLRQGLVVFQFAVAIALLAGTGIVLRQFQYMQASNLGFDRERVVVADLRALPNEAVADGHRTLAQRLTRYPEVQAASATQSVPGRSVSEGLLVIPQGKADDETRTLQRYRVAPSYLQTVGIDVVAGRDFRPEDRDASDPTPTVINAEAVRDMGWASPEEALGKTFRRPFGDDPPTFEVVGVVENYHHFSLHETVRPLYMVLEGQAYAYLALRVEAGAEEAALERLRSAWTEVYGGRSLNYFFLDSDFAQQYRSEERLARIFAGFSGLAIFVACLGLFGVAAYTTRQRRKEVTVRKVLGAKTSQLVRLLSAEYAALVGLAFLVAAPVVWVGARRWLQNFAYHTQVEGWALVGAGTIVAVAALLVVGGQALRVAAVDPARTLRQDG